MRLDLTARHLTVTPAIRQAVHDRLAHVERLLNRSAHSAQVVITRDKLRFRVEVTLHARGEHFIHGEATGRSWEVALSAACAKIERQAERLKTKWTDGRRRARAPRGVPPPAPASQDGAEADREVRIIRVRRYAVKPMSIDEAALEMSGSGTAFLVFRNARTESVAVLYRRPDGHLGLIEPEA